MDNSIYIALSKQTGMMRDMAVTANNIANADTTGFGAQDMIFEKYIVDDGNRNKMAFANDIATWRDTESGGYKETGNALDMAIQGPGYFQVETPLGQRFTRGGNFKIDAEGTLVTSDGYAVLDEAGQHITFNEEDKEITIGETGNITVDGEDRGRVGVVEFDNPQLLEHVAGSMYRSDAASRPSDRSRVMQGVLENSNVKPVLELTHMIDVNRSASNTAKFIESMYDLERKASNIITKQQ